MSENEKGKENGNNGKKRRIILYAESGHWEVKFKISEGEKEFTPPEINRLARAIKSAYRVRIGEYRLEQRRKAGAVQKEKDVELKKEAIKRRKEEDKKALEKKKAEKKKLHEIKGE